MSTPAKTVLVTGASQGIGAALVARFLERGDNVVANSRHLTASKAFAPSPRLALVDGDIGQPETAWKIAETAVERFGRIDTLVNNAGVFIPKPFTAYTTQEFDTLVSTVLGGFFHISQHAVRQMLTQKSGHIVNFSTVLVDQPVAGVPCALQALTKGGLNAVTRALAIEYAPQGIRVNTISPGIIKTPMHDPKTYDTLAKFHPLGRMGTIEEIVDAVLYLDGAEFVTGEILHIDGGAHAGKW